jgi:hypothetical protein
MLSNRSLNARRARNVVECCRSVPSEYALAFQMDKVLLIIEGPCESKHELHNLSMVVGVAGSTTLKRGMNNCDLSVSLTKALLGLLCLE